MYWFYSSQRQINTAVMFGPINGKELKEEVDSLAAGLLFLLSIITVLQLPVHDLTNHRSGHQAEQLQHAEDGGVQTH